jgi:hypothetical protein
MLSNFSPIESSPLKLCIVSRTTERILKSGRSKQIAGGGYLFHDQLTGGKRTAVHANLSELDVSSVLL